MKNEPRTPRPPATAARHLARALLILGGIALFLLVAFNGAIAYLHTERGTAWLARVGLGAANAAITGQIHAEHTTTEGTHIIILGATLTDAEGARVAFVERIDVDIVWSALLRGRIEAREVELTRPTFSVALDDEGSNLERTFAPKHPGPEGAPAHPPPITFVVRHFEIEDGRFDLQSPEGPPLLLQTLTLQGAGNYALRSQEFQLDVRGNGALDKPTPGPLTIAVHGEHRGGNWVADVDVRAAGASVAGDLRRDGSDGLDGHLSVDLPPSLARALVRGWPLRVPLVLTAEAKRAGAGFLVSGQAAAGRTRVDLKAEVNVEHASTRHLDVSARHINLAELLGRGPETDLAFTLAGAGGGTTLQTASGNLTLSVPTSHVRGAEVGPVEVALHVDKGQFDLSSLRASLPGLVLKGGGRGNTRTLSGTFGLEVSDLAALGKTFGDLFGSFPPLAGHGALHVALSGRTRHPGLEGSGSFEALAVGPVSAQALEFSFKLPDVLRPLDATLSLSANVLNVSGRPIRDVHASLGTQGSEVSLQVRAAGPVQVQVAGTSDGDGRGLLVDSLSLAFPEGSWTLARPAAVRFDEKRLETERLELVSGSQSIAFAGRVANGHVDATLQLTALDLTHLPAVAIPPSVRMAGLLDAAVTVHGPEQRPDVGLEATLSGGAWHGLRDLSAHLTGARRAERLSLQAHAVAVGSALDVEAEVPELALSRRIHQPLLLHLSAHGVDVGPALCQLGSAGLWARGCPSGVALVTAQANVDATLRGFADGPSVQLALDVVGVRFKETPPAEAHLALKGDDTHPLALTFTGKALGGPVSLNAELAATTGQLLARRHSWEGLRTLPVQATLAASDLSLSYLHTAGLVRQDVEGSAEVHADLRGTLAMPEGTADVMVRKLNVAPWPAGDAHLVATAAKTVDVRLTLEGAAGEKGFIHAAVDAPLSEISTTSSPEQLAHAKLLLEGELGPFNFRDLPLDATRLRRDRRLLDGTFQAKFEGHGTLLAPTATATLTATGLGPSDGAHFEGTAQLHSAEGKQTATVRLQSATGGSLNLDAEMQLDLSLPAFRRGLVLKEAPLKAHLHSERFEPDFIASLVPSMRSIGGKLQIEGQASGTLASPKLDGSISWTDGSVGIIGFGVYQAIQFQAKADNEHFAIEQLSARVQGGTLSLKLQGTRGADGFALSGALSTSDLPVVFDDQLWCIATLKADLTGSVMPWQVNLSRINISQADLQLPEARRRDLQDLRSPSDVVLTRNGVPIDARQALRAAAFDPRRRATVVGGAEPLEKPFLRLSLEAPNHIAVRSKDVTLELALSKPFQVNLGEQAELFGDVKILRGRGNVWGRRFDVQPGGQVRFVGAPELALLDVTGVYTSVQSQAKVYMHFSGETTDVKVTPSSDPPMSESEIYTLLATGRTSLVQSNLGSSTAVGGGDAGASILGSWAANELKKAVGVALPIDVLSVEVSNDERGMNQTRLEAGKYLTDDIYIGYQARTNADPFRYQNSNAIRVEYRFLRRWSLQLEYGDANAGSLDAVWSRDY